MIKHITNLRNYIGIDNYIWIYAWNSDTMQFYCVPKRNNTNDVIAEPIAVNLSSNFKQKYNHLLIITKNLNKFEERILELKSLNIRIIKSDKRSNGHLIMNELTATQIINRDNIGDAVFVYCSRVMELYTHLKDNYYYFYIEAMGNYQDSIQCFFNHKRRIDNNFESRGLFKIISSDDNDVEDTIEFVSSNVDDQHFPPYKITAFDIETARLDNKFPTGDTLYDRVCTVAFQTVTVKNVSEPRNYENVENLILIYSGNVFSDKNKVDGNTRIIFCSTEKELLIKFLHYIALPNAMFITGWNIINFDYKILLKRMIRYGLFPEYLNRKKLHAFCSLRDRACDIAPPWKLSIDTMASRKRFFPRHLPINPPSNSIDITAKVLLGSNDGGEGGEGGKFKIDISKINHIYYLIEKQMNNDENIVEIKKYLKELITYNIRDVELVTKLNGVLQIIQILVPLSLLADLNPGDCIHYNTTKVGVTYMKNQFQSVILAPIDYNLIYNSNSNAGLLPLHKEEKEKNNDDDDDKNIRGKKGTYKGATVLEPKIGVHKSDETTIIGSVDFASLYPNIMLSYGIIRGYVTKVSKKKYKQSWNEHFIPLHTPDDTKNVYLSYRKNIEKCPISYLCKRLIEKRKINRQSAPTVANALKILVNSLYGICGVQGSPLYDQIAATMITAYGRYHLMRAKTYFESEFERLTVLYGDTDSLFIKCVNSRLTLQEMTDRYNEYLARECGLKSIQLSVDGIYQSIIFIRKKLYMAKIKSKNKCYKLSGFPQRLEPRIFELMIQSLHTILDLSTSSTNLKLDVQNFYLNLFNNCVNNIKDPSYSVKVNPLHSYKSKTSKQYYVGSLYEKFYKTPILDTTYIPIYELIPLVKNIDKKSLKLCLKDYFDDNLHTLNKSAFLTETFCKTFDPILEVIMNNNNNNNNPSLKSLCEQYIEKMQNESLLKYIKGGYGIFDFSKYKFCTSNVKISFINAWPKFYKDFLYMKNVNKKICWIREEEEEEENLKRDAILKRRNIFLSITILSNSSSNNKNNGNNISIALLSPSISSNNLNQLKFKNINDLKVFLSNFIKNTINKDTKNITMKNIYVKIKNVFSNHRDILNFLAFIYNKNFTQLEVENITNNKYLIILPFIAIKSNNDDTNYQFTYF